MGLVAERALDWRPELIGVARYEPSDEKDTAEVALVVQDYWQGKGLGTILLREILRAGEANGIRAFRAHVLADNNRVLAMLSRLTDIQQRQSRATRQSQVRATLAASLAPQEVVRLPRNRDQQMSHLRVLGV
jgi:N-acetylglutamate synthase-like GNAT family acetyltransferase